jgi:hypothetical protein
VREPAGRDGRRRTVTDRVVLGRVEVPPRDVVVRDVREVVVRELRREVGVGRFARVVGDERVAVDGPGLPARPAGVVGTALVGLAAEGLARLGVAGEGVERRPVGADDVGGVRPRVGPRDVGVAGVAGRFARPEQQGEVHHRVDDHPAVGPRVGVVGRPPRLDQPRHRVKPVGEQVGRPDRRHAGGLAAGQAVVGDRRQRVEKPQVVGVGFARLQAAAERLDLRARGVAEPPLSGDLARQPAQPRPERGRPAVGVARRPVDEVVAGGLGKAVVKRIEVVADAVGRVVERRLERPPGDVGIGSVTGRTAGVVDRGRQRLR